jgi:hypothetical protein
VPDQVIIYVGDDECCANEEFFKLLGADFDAIKEVEIPRWCGMHDYLKVWRLKNVVARQKTEDAGRLPERTNVLVEK